MAQQLPGGQIQPAAQPVSTFVRPVERAVAGAAQPPGIPRVSGIEVINQGGGGSVQGANNLQALAAALVPFNAALRDLVGGGLELHASSEYKKGQNEAARAAVLVNQQRLQSMGQYAAENRKLDGKDAIAAMAMDSINPYRRAGRENALARVAASEVGAALLAEYRNTPGLEQMDSGDPRIEQVKANATNKLLERYGINPGSAGFTDYVAPAISEAWGRITEKQWDDRQTYLKGTIPVTATAEVAGIYANAIEKRQITVFDSLGRPTVITPANGAQWDNALLRQMQDSLDKVIDESGLRGEATKARQAVVEQLHAAGLARRDTTLQRLARQLAVGPPGPDGTRPKAGVAMFTDLLDQEIKYGDFAAKKKLEEFSGKAALALAAAGGDPAARQAAMLRLSDEAGRMGIPADQALKTVADLGGTVDKLQGLITDPGQTERFLLEAETTRFGEQWNTPQFLQELEQQLPGLPEDEKTRLRNQAAELIRRKESERSVAPSGVVNQLIDGRIKANLRANYPASVTQAAMRGNSVAAFMESGNANVAESAQRQFQAYQQHVRNRLAEEAAKRKVPRLPDADAIRIAGQALDEYGKTNPRALQYLFPGVGPEPSVGGAGAADAPPPPPPPGARSPGGQPPNPRTLMGAPPAPRLPAGGGAQRPAPRPRAAAPAPQQPLISANQLDTADQNAVREFRSQAILRPQSIVQEVLNLANGGRPPAALRRAARHAGVSPAEFLLKQADFFRNGINIPDEVRKQILRDGRQSRAAGDYMRGLPGAAANLVATASGAGLVAKGQTWLLDVLSSALTPPAMAASVQMPPPRSIRRSTFGPAFSGRSPVSVEQLVTLARSAGFNNQDAAVMAAIAMAESSGKPWAHNPNRSTGDNSYGLWQINMIDRMGPERRREFGIGRNEALFDPVTNAAAARRVHGSQGFRAWSVYRSGAYRQYLPAAMRAATRR